MADLREAFRLAACREFAAVPAEQTLCYGFSVPFERRMKRLLRAQARCCWPLVNTAAKRLLVAVLLMLLLLSTVMAIRPVRQRVIRFFVEVYEEYFEIRFGEKESWDIPERTEPMVRYTLTALPEGYEESKCVTLDSIFWTEWENRFDEKIVLRQETATNEIKSDREKQNWEQIRIEGKTVRHHFDNDQHVFVWEQYEYVFMLTVHKDLSVEEILAMINSLKNM